MATFAVSSEKQMLTLPGDAVRQIQWRFADRFDLQMLVQSSRGVARGTVAQLVAAGERNTHEWTPGKNEMMEAFDRAGITAAFMEPEEGGFISGPKNLALSLAAFELAWVDGGAATASLAGFLALAPIHERGTPEQISRYKSLSAPPQPGEDRKPWRGAFALTEPIPYVGVDTGMLSGKVRVAEWKDGEEPWLQVDKRGRFITNIAFANFVTAAVGSDDPRIKGSCMVILEETDEGIFDRGTPTKKLVHQLSSTGDPIFNLKVPASRIVGGYTVKDGVIVPNFNHGEVIEAVFRRTRVAVGLMTAAKLLSAVEPVIRYQRQRFRGAEGAKPGSVRYEQGIQQREDALHRLVDIWATGEAAHIAGLCHGAPLRRTRTRRKAEDGHPQRARHRRRPRRDEGPQRKRRPRHRIALAQTGRSRLRRARSRSAGPVCADGCRGQRPLPRHQALEHRPRRQHDARSRQPHGRLRHHRRLPRLPGQQMDGCATRSHLRRPRSRAAPPVDGDHDHRGIPGPVPLVDRADAAASPRCAPAPAPARWPRPCRCGSGPSTTCKRPPIPTAASSTTGSARA